MDNLPQITTWLHIGLGVICMISGVIALASRKTRGRHPNAGRSFTVSLALAYGAILFNIVLSKNVFMLGIGWMAVFAGVEGWRALLRFRGSLAPAPTAFDYILGGATTLLSLGLVGFGIRVVVTSNVVMGLVCIGFGVLGGFLMLGSRQRWKSPPSKPQWLAVHISMMTGAFSAALTAFLAIQFSGHLGGFEWVVWVAPTLLMARYASQEKRRRGLEGDA